MVWNNCLQCILNLPVTERLCYLGCASADAKHHCARGDPLNSRTPSGPHSLGAQQVSEG